MARPSGEKTRCSGQWTEARFKSFVQSLLRQGTRKWAPINNVMRSARKSRGMYLCNCCEELVPLTTKQGRKKQKNVFVDHIVPVVDPEVGFTNWDEYIENMFSEEENLQVLCKECHDIKTSEERKLAVERRRKEKENNGKNQ